MAEFLSDEWLEEMTTAAAAQPRSELGKAPPVVIQQVITGGPAGEQHFVIEIGSGSPRFLPGRSQRAVASVGEDYQTAAALARGDLGVADAFEGRVRIGGDLAAAVAGAEAFLGWQDVFAAVRQRTSY